jgi:hypothetical protein
MHDSKLIALVRTLSPAERRRFRKWVRSPIHNANERISAFYMFLDGRTDWTPRTLDRSRVYRQLFGAGAYDDLALRRLMSEFLRVLEAFLAYEAWRSEPMGHALDLSRLYFDRQQGGEALARLEAAETLLHRQPIRDARYHLDTYRLQEERFRQTPARDAALNLQEMADALDRFFALELLRNACTAASHQAIYRTTYHLPYLEAVLGDCAKGRYDATPAVLLYYHSYRCLTESDGIADFQALKAMLPAAAGWLRPAELRATLLVAINYSIRRLNTDEPAFLREVFELYRLGLQQGVFVENGSLSRFTFKNIVSAALKLGEVDWTQAFIRTYAPLLPAAFRPSYEQFCLARLHYEQGDYSSAQSLLQEVAFDDVFLDLGARVLLAKIYFQTAEWRLLGGFLQTFERFVRRKKKLAYHAPNYLNIIHLTQRLLLRHSGQRAYAPSEWESLGQQIREARPLTEREWLLEKWEAGGG